jgi:uncharacterized membrane protein YeaQ/YmgE (transglycosylase-associated protein family)
MNFFAWLLSVACIAWLTGALLRIEMGRWGVLLIPAGVLGASMGNALLKLLSGRPVTEHYELAIINLSMMFFGTLILLAAFNFARIGRLR